MTTPNYSEHFQKIEAAHKDRQQRKMLNIDVIETSGVQIPAHLVEGWVVLKSADGHDHRSDVTYLEGPALEAARHWGTDDLQPGHDFPLAKDRSLGKSPCGCVYMQTPETVAKAESEAWLASRQETVTKTAGGWSPEEIAWFEAETKRIQP